MKISFRNRNLGYPLLTPEPRDYVSGGFDIEKPDARRGADAVTVHISYKLESEFLSELVDDNAAAFYTLATCDGLFMREATCKTTERVQTHHFDLSRWSGVVEMMPYVIATRRIEGFKSDEHDDEFAIVAPDGFTIEPANILAIGNIHEVDIDETGSASSVIDIQASRNVKRGRFDIDLANQRVTVLVSSADFDILQAAIDHPNEARRATMWPSLYLHVIAEGVRNLPEFGDYAWASSFDRALRKSGFEPDDADALHRNALEYAQQMIYDEEEVYPLGMMLTAFTEEDAESRDYDL